MKCSELSSIINKFSGFVAAAGGRKEGADSLNSLLQLAPTRTVAQLAKVLLTTASSSHSTGNEIADAISFANELHNALSGIAKAAVLTDLQAISGALDLHVNNEMQQLISNTQIALSGKKVTEIAPVREKVIRAYNHELEVALGDDDGFASVIKRLQDDLDIRKSEILALAKRFAFATVTSRAAALKKIQARHQSLMTSRAKAAATAGRIAG
jgi:hypothetical protein